MKESMYFVFDNIKSTDMGLVNVQVDNKGLLEETFVADKEIKEIKIRGRDKPYFAGVERQPLEFGLSFYFEDNYDTNKLREVARWLDQDEYKSFYTTDNTNRIFKCMLVSDSKLLHNGLKQGYVNLNFRCDSPYSYSPIYQTPIYNSVSEQDIEIQNYGDLDCHPIIYIQKIGDGDITIKNLSDSGKEFTFTTLVDGEELEIDCENEIIKTNIDNFYRYDSFNDNYLRLLYGANRLQLTGNFKLIMKYRFKTLQG